MALQLSGDAGINRLVERKPKYHSLLLQWQNKWDRLIDVYRISFTVTSYFLFILVCNLSSEFDLIQKLGFYIVVPHMSFWFGC